jgi:hypothetical protein
VKEYFEIINVKHFKKPGPSSEIHLEQSRKKGISKVLLEAL